jgi:hypothetical protein
MMRMTFLADSAGAGVIIVDEVPPHPAIVSIICAMTTSETTALILLILFNITNFLLCRIVVTNRREANKYFITVGCQL